MPFSGGTFNRVYDWTDEQAASPIEISKLDAQEVDIAAGLSNCILRDGTGVPTAATPWNSQKITGLGNATADADALNRVTADARYLALSGGTVAGTVTATSFSGAGGSLTGLSATQLTSGTVPDARFPATLPAASGANLTALNASNLTSGTVADAHISATSVNQHNASITGRNITGKSGIAKTLSTSVASAGSDGDIWYQY